MWLFNYLIFTDPSGSTRDCTIYSPSLTTDGAVMHIGDRLQNVILYCICTRMTNVAVGPAIWFIDGTAVTTTASGNNPYTRDNIPSPLIIPSFTATHAGTYGCGGFSNSPTVTINLAMSGMCNY